MWTTQEGLKRDDKFWQNWETYMRSSSLVLMLWFWNSGEPGLDLTAWEKTVGIDEMPREKMVSGKKRK